MIYSVFLTDILSNNIDKPIPPIYYYLFNRHNI